MKYPLMLALAVAPLVFSLVACDPTPSSSGETFEDAAEALVHYTDTDGLEFSVPAGWQWHRPSADLSSPVVLTYQPEKGPKQSMMLYPATAAPPDASLWFEQERAKNRFSANSVDWKKTVNSEDGMLMSAGMGEIDGKPHIILAGSCINPLGHYLFWESAFRQTEPLELDEPMNRVVAVAQSYCPLPLQPGNLSQIALFNPHYLDEDQIEAAFFRQTQRSGGSIGWNNDYALMLDNGLAYRGFPQTAFGQFDMVASLSNEPERWSRWRQRGGDYQLLVDGEWQSLDQYRACDPAEKGTTLDGKYAVLYGYFSPYSSSSTRSGAVMSKAGMFERWSTSNGGSTLGYGQTATASFYERDDESSFTGVIGSNFAASGSGKRSANAHRTGSYEIDGWHINFNYNNGVKQSQMFCRMRGGDRIYFLGDIHYLDKDEDA